MQDGCKVYMDSYTVTWTIFKTHRLEVDLTQNRETMARQNLTTIDLILFFMCENHA